VSRAGLDKRPADVAAMFDAVAARYDLTNDALSLGLDRWWRRLVTAAVAARPGERILDLATGTGTSAEPLASTGADVTGCDFSLGMLQEGRRRGAGAAGVRLVAGDALALPFRDACFDAVTCSFGLRNVVDPLRALGELRRVTRPGGRLVLVEFSHPRWPPFRRLYLAYLLAALPAVARLVSSDPESYDYLAASIRAWPDQGGLARLLVDAGWREVAWRDATGGIVAVHRGRRA
jgi:demethylmenaquinone methyltransferase/2-methoxy-6-polyprenyl-1,4-benzoquinol methylase